MNVITHRYITCKQPRHSGASAHLDLVIGTQLGATTMARTRNALYALTLTALLVAPAIVHAAESVEMRVSASVISNCKIQSVSNIQFGLLDPGTAANLQANGVVSLSCTKGVDFALYANQGENPTPQGGRRMKSGTNQYLPYTLSSNQYSGTGQGFSRPIDINITANINGSDYRDLPADTYNDVIRISLEP